MGYIKDLIKEATEAGDLTGNVYLVVDADNGTHKVLIGNIGNVIDNLDLSGDLTVGGDLTADNITEKASFTPVVSDASSGGNTATASLIQGEYVRVGGMVCVQITLDNLDTSGMTGGNDLYIQGLPFTCGSSNGANGSVLNANNTFSGTILTARIGAGQDYMRIAESSSGNTFDFLTVSEVSSGDGDFYISITYLID